MHTHPKGIFSNGIAWGLYIGMFVEIALFFTYSHIMSVYKATSDLDASRLEQSLDTTFFGLVAVALLVGLPLSITNFKNGFKRTGSVGVALNILVFPFALTLHFCFALATA